MLQSRIDMSRTKSFLLLQARERYMAEFNPEVGLNYYLYVKQCIVIQITHNFDVALADLVDSNWPIRIVHY